MSLACFGLVMFGVHERVSAQFVFVVFVCASCFRYFDLLVITLFGFGVGFGFLYGSCSGLSFSGVLL